MRDEGHVLLMSHQQSSSCNCVPFTAAFDIQQTLDTYYDMLNECFCNKIRPAGHNTLHWPGENITG